MSSFDRRRFMIAVSSVGAATILSSRAYADPGVSGDKILFGQVAVFDGPASALGIGMRDGLTAAFVEAVKSLAGQTAKATEDVTAQLNSIQSAAGEARQSMSQLDAIIGQVSKMVESVAETVAQQSISVATISNGANFASTEAKSGSEAISRVANVSAGARATAGDVKSLAGAVANDAERLDGHIDRFLQAVRAA